VSVGGGETVLPINIPSCERLEKNSNYIKIIYVLHEHRLNFIDYL
jgi:hypothetical protein